MTKRKLLKPVYFLTWTTYGTWLPGDIRGSKSRKPSPFGYPDIIPNSKLTKFSKSEMKNSNYVLDTRRQKIALSAIIRKGSKECYNLIAVQVRTNHIHMIIQAGDVSGVETISLLKNSISRTINLKLKEQNGIKRWTRGGFFKIINEEDSLISAIDYVINGQGERLEFFVSSDYEYLLR